VSLGAVRASVDIVVPTLGRPSLAVLLRALAGSGGPPPRAVILVDDRRQRGRPLLAEPVPGRLAAALRVLPGGARGPAAARNTGWRESDADWIAFLDDDVVPAGDWLHRLAEDLAAAERVGPAVAGSQGRVSVPLPTGRRPTDWERNVAGLGSALWATADLAYRRAALAGVGGFDERFPRAYREDADLGLRLVDAGWVIVRGRRVVVHPVRPADRWVSVRLQAGNADDARMRALHGPDWRVRAGVPAGRRPRHLATTAAALAGLIGLAGGRRRLAGAGLVGWLAATGELAWSRIAPGPRTADEVATMLATSALLPAAACWHWLRGWATVAPGVVPRVRRGVVPRVRPAGRLGSGSPATRTRGWGWPAAVLFDRDGTLVRDEPYNGDPERVELMPGARVALARLRSAGIPVAVVSNQSGVGRGLLTMRQVEAVNRRVEQLLGPLGPVLVCPHGPDDGCGCRKPADGLIRAAAAALGVSPERCAVVGDIGADVAAARAAGARAVLVPTPVTRPEEVRAAPEVAADLEAAVDLLLGGEPGR
jgi:histidinol-phosphate phosphatase family protein